MTIVLYFNFINGFYLYYLLFTFYYIQLAREKFHIYYAIEYNV